MKRAIRRILPILAVGLAAAGTAAVVHPASAAESPSYRAVLGFTLTRGDSVYLQINGGYTCYSDFAVGVRKEVSVKVKPGQSIQVFSSESCYNSLNIGNVVITSDGQRAEFTL